MKTYVVILNWNGKKHIQACLSSLEKQTYGKFRVVFVDNGSTDGSEEYVKKHFPNVKFIETGKNLGFAEGNNVGIRYALKDRGAKHIVLLNNDTSVHKDWLRELVEVAECDKSIGMVGSKTYFQDRKTIDTLGLQMYKSGLAWDIKNERNLFTLFCPSGVSALYKRELLEDVKLGNEFFDKAFFLYAEDLDLGFRARLMGWKASCALNSIVYHKHGASSKGSNLATYQGHRNNLWVITKNYPLSLLALYSFHILITQLGSVIIYSLRGKPSLIIKAKLASILGLPRMLAKRWQIQKNRKISSSELRKLLLPGLAAKPADA